MRAAVALVLALSLAAVGSARAVPCDPSGVDAAAIAAARAEIAAECDCAGAATHGAYTSCAAGIVATRIGTGMLNRKCGGQVKRCAARSTCGKPGAVTCCKTNRKGKTTCSVKRDATQCKPPGGGTATVGSAGSCCDACGPGGGDPVCGNLIVEEGELCDESTGPSAACPEPSGKLRCARPGEAGACDRCCGRSVGDLGTGLICTGAADTACCGFCARFGPGHRCTDCKDAACSCGTLGDACNDSSCCAGYACRPPASDFELGTCCADTGTGCGSGGDCCSGVCAAGVCQ
jgi:hypothetical protein